ncbi:hypothetical protein [Actinomadura chokoriensis]|uniref:Uncharacterized protein n=1 Tax=Actinomadura chokoriensis TaxID=454156 RepID=A0ABV4R0Z6_9ACTN
MLLVSGQARGDLGRSLPMADPCRSQSTAHQVRWTTRRNPARHGEVSHIAAMNIAGM